MLLPPPPEADCAPGGGGANSHQGSCSAAALPRWEAQGTVRGRQGAPRLDTSSGPNSNWGGSGFSLVPFYLKLRVRRPEPASCGGGPLSPRWQRRPAGVGDQPLWPWWRARCRGPLVDCGGGCVPTKLRSQARAGGQTSPGPGQEGQGQRGRESGASPEAPVGSLCRRHSGCSAASPLGLPSCVLAIGASPVGVPALTHGALLLCAVSHMPANVTGGTRPPWAEPPARMPRVCRGAAGSPSAGRTSV